MREVRRRRRQQIEEAVVQKVQTHLAQIHLLDLMLRLSLLPRSFCSLKLYESLRLSFHPLGFRTTTIEKERQRIMHNFQGFKKTEQLNMTASESKGKPGKKVMRGRKRGRIVQCYPVDPQRSPFPCPHPRNQT